MTTPIQNKQFAYDKLNDKGYEIQKTVLDGDVIIAKVEPLQPVNNDNKPFKDSSEIYKSIVPNIVDKVYDTLNHDGYEIKKVRIRSDRTLTVGDKICSRTANK